LIAASAKNFRYAGRQSNKCDAKAQRSADAVDQQRAPGTGSSLSYRGVCCAQISKSRCRLEAYVIGQPDERTLRRSDVFRKPAIGIGLEDRLRERPAPEITLKGEAAAVHDFAAAAGAARSASARRVDVNAVTCLDRVHLAAYLRDDAGGIEAENRRELRQRQVGKPFRPFREHVFQIRHHAAGLDGHEYVGWARFGHGNLLDQQGAADFVHACCEHRLH
jgi:hypothetical protein